MAAPSDYRHDPFSDVSTAATFTERHIIPSVSPYVINLNEIPQKNSPSTMTVKAITNVNGSTVTYGSTFAEVATNPSSNEFWPDYNTGADGDENWNTGKLLFNSSNAGQLVEIRYTATGTLAGVKSNRYPAWWLDRGDGSDGDFAPTTNTTISGEKNYKSVYIPNGVTVSVNGFVKVKCQGSFMNAGIITATGRGAYGGTGGARSEVSDDFVYSAGGAGTSSITNYGGAGGAGQYSAGGTGGKMLFAGLHLTQKEDVLALLEGGIICCGAGGGGGGAGRNQGIYVNGGAGGGGGGFISIIADSFKNVNSITADGSPGSNGGGGGGGGAGGCIAIIANSIISRGTISAQGGTGGGASYDSWGNAAAGSAGGNGYIFIKEMGVI